MSAIDLSADIGLAALFLLAANILLGLLLSARYNPWTRWPHRRINYFRLHNWTGYLALAVAGAHPVVLLFSSTAGFRVLDVVYPLHSPKQPIINTLGALSLYLLVVVVVTSYYRPKLRRSTWKVLHYLAYAVAVLFFIHGIWSDPTIQGKAIDPLDGEKVAVEACAVLVIAATMLRVRVALRHRATRSATARRRLPSAA
ncbi:MAG TPA: ferric reductase-like transmembrane domain-containing protein [Gemmatimonadaceae bacterium]|nr:ferric reductase-like transmembrane domain-containing protein [Gemmatimonadaceae bacterium]